MARAWLFLLATPIALASANPDTVNERIPVGKGTGKPLGAGLRPELAGAAQCGAQGSCGENLPHTTSPPA